MEKLTFGHLAPYLPYGLKIKVEPISDLYSERIAELDCLCFKDLCVTLTGSPDYYFEDLEPDINIKPLLFPLSMLITEIEHNGQRFIPIVELLKINQTDHEHGVVPKYDIIKMWHSDSSLFKTLTHFYTIRFSYETSGGVVIMDLCYDTQFNRFTKRQITPNEAPKWLQYDILEEKLLEWHLDKFKLIEKGLAVDKSSLPL